MLGEFTQFHFIRPAFLLLAPVVVLLWVAAKRSLGSSGWEHYLPLETIRALQVGESKQSSWWQWYILFAALILCFAAAGPTWIKQALPTLQNQRALVVILDLSPSMLAQDLKPDRLTRAKYKLIDILRQYQDGQVALIAYAGDAHTVSPLTDDPKTLQALLPALHPAIMPSQGSNIESAIVLARQLLRDAKLNSGEVLLITDGIATSAMATLRKELGSSIALSILGVGGTESAPIPAKGGGFLRGRDGQIILSRVNEPELKQLASQLDGRYARLSNNEADVNFLIRDDFQTDSSTEQTASDTSFDGWADMGHWFLLLVLPVAAWCFRRGFIYCLPLLFLMPIEHPRADESAKSDAVSKGIDDNQSERFKQSADGFSWSHLWRTPDQRAHDLVQRGQYADAANTFERKDWRAVANYKNGDYAAAAQQLEGATDAISLYNKANALALNGELEKALKTYNQALATQPEHADAKHNKQVVEQLMQQQQNQEQQNDQQSEQQENQEQNQDSSESSSDQSQSSDKQTPQDQKSENQEQESQESQSADEQDKNDPSSPQPDEAEKEDQTDSSKPESTDSDEEQESDTVEQAGEEPSDEQGDEQESSQLMAEESSEALKDTSEQWLRGIKDDPSGLLRRKFQYQAEQNKRSAPQQNSTEERY